MRGLQHPRRGRCLHSVKSGVHDGGVVEGPRNPIQEEAFEQFYAFSKRGCRGHPIAQTLNLGPEDARAIEVTIDEFAHGNFEELPEAEGLKENGERFQTTAEPNVDAPIDAGAYEHNFVGLGASTVAQFDGGVIAEFKLHGVFESGRHGLNKFRTTRIELSLCKGPHIGAQFGAGWGGLNVTHVQIDVEYVDGELPAAKSAPRCFER